ncbi:chemotaxis protein CheW [Shewanella gaetbuli]|uniref:Chemotaxis protein CheW n=1 Tax=Shewanella gaetbuli TaxID=220752 RepID=A0A9X2CKI4_9GAMM|nr:chemotaxis protein CheW [Shewanella gaetbuli]MCL1141664.1 chemotaxis protein CheW [Shewanella gaetbuli]
MSKSVDETVFDYFAMLLTEPSTSTNEKTDNINKNTPVDDPKLSKVSRAKSSSASVAESSAKTAKSKSSTNDVGTKTLTPPTTADNKSSTEYVAKTASNDKALSPATPINRPDTARTTRFIEPETSINKPALEKLLSAVSEPQVTKVLPAAKSAMSVDEIKASAEKMRQTLASSAGKVSKQTTNQHKTTQKSELVDKEINSLVDINTKETTAKTINKAIINNDEQKVTPAETQTGATPPSITQSIQEVLDDEFQVLFFKVAGLTLAVPLVSLGGIVKVERYNHIIGRPKWFLGVQPHRDEQINVVDTCAWVMPEKYSPELAESVEYQYIVMLEDSRWGLACESLINSVKIDKSHVNWREKSGKRPWLAGVVKKQMCGILHVQALIEMLDAGLGCQDTIDRG